MIQQRGLAHAFSRLDAAERCEQSLVWHIAAVHGGINIASTAVLPLIPSDDSVTETWEQPASNHRQHDGHAAWAFITVEKSTKKRNRDAPVTHASSFGTSS